MTFRTPAMQDLGMGVDLLYSTTRAYLALLQGYFRENPPGKGLMHWSPDPQQTEIYITDQRSVDRGIADRCPAVITQCQAGSHLGTSHAQYAQRPDLQDVWVNADLVQGQVYLHCIAAEGVEARLLAWTVSRILIVFRPLLHRMGRLHQTGPQIVIGPEQPASEEISGAGQGDFTRVVVVSPFVVQWRADVSEAPDDPFRIRLRNMEQYAQTAFGTFGMGG